MQVKIGPVDKHERRIPMMSLALNRLSFRLSLVAGDADSPLFETMENFPEYEGNEYRDYFSEKNMRECSAESILLDHPPEWYSAIPSFVSRNGMRIMLPVILRIVLERRREFVDLYDALGYFFKRDAASENGFLRSLDREDVESIIDVIEEIKKAGERTPAYAGYRDHISEEILSTLHELQSK